MFDMSEKDLAYYDSVRKQETENVTYEIWFCDHSEDRVNYPDRLMMIVPKCIRAYFEEGTMITSGKFKTIRVLKQTTKREWIGIMPSPKKED